MKKPSLLLLSAFAGLNSAGAKAIRIFLLAFVFSWISSISNAQVVVVSPGDTNVCYTTAVGSPGSTCTTLGNITITETLPSDFSAGFDVFSLSVPAGWNFCTSTPTPTITAAAGGDVVGITYAFTGTSVITVTVAATGATKADQITISGLRVQPSTTTPAMLYIYPTAVSGVNGLVTGTSGTNFGFLRVIPGTIVGLTSHCVGDVDNYASGLVPGGTWSVSSPKMSVDASGNVTFLLPGTDTLMYTVAGCTAFLQLTINKQPAHSIFTNAYVTTVPNNILVNGVCAWFDSFYVKNVDSLGYFSTGGVTGTGYATFFGSAPTGHGVVHANAPGKDYITFTIPGTGCSVTDTFIVNQLPNIITGNDTICVGGTTVLGNTVIPGVWSASNGNATINSSTGFVTGFTAGRDTVFYTLPTGCKRDTIVIVNPLPSAISGSTSICIGTNYVLSDATLLGTWTVSNTLVSITPSGNTVLVTPDTTVGTTTLTYTITRTGCYVTTVLTVNPLPAPITANQGAECVHDNVIQLSDATSGGAWSASNTSAFVSTTGQVRGDTAIFGGSQDTITYKLTTGCSVTYVVTINQLPSPITGPDSFCVGSIGTYVDTTTSFGGAPTWSVSPTGITLPTSGTGVTFGMLGVAPGGVITLTFKLGTGCSTNRTVTVNPLPDTVTGPHLLCTGQTATLSDATPGVTWTSSNTGIATIDTFTGFVQADLVNTGSVVFTASLGTGCKVFFTMTVTPYPDMPKAIGGRTTLCYNDTVTLYDVKAPGGTWTSGNSAVATVNLVTGLVTAGNTVPGTATITYTISSGCDTVITITVNPITPIYGPNTICQGDSIQLNDATTGGIFKSAGPATSSGPTTTVSGVAVAEVRGLLPGSDRITYTTSAGCKATFDVTVYPTAPIKGKDSVCVNDSVFLSDAISGGKWSVGNSSVASIDTNRGVLTGVASGTVLVIYTLPSGCKVYYVVRVNPLPDPITVSSHTVCQGGTVQFADGAPGGTWSLVTPPAFGIINSTTGLYTSVKDSVDTVIYQFPTGCKVSDTVRVFPLLPIYGSDTICVGNTTQLNDTTKLMGGGFTWISDNNPVATIDPITGLVTGVSQGTATITYLLSTGCQATDTVYVNPLPGLITGRDSVCVGDTTTYFNTVPGGIWTSGKTSVATIDPVTGVITGVSAGTATITYKLVPTGCYVVDSVRVDGIPNPLSGHNYVCIGFSSLLTDATAGGTWTSTDTFIAKVDTFTGVVTSVKPGVDTIFYTLTATGCNASLSFTVFGQPPVATTTPTIICRGSNVSLSAAGADIGTILGSYTWTPATGLSSTAGVTVVASPTITTTYTVIGTTFYGCKDTVTVTVPVDSLLNHIAVTGPDSICIGTCAHLVASGRDGSLFAWTPTVGLSCTICDTTTACPTTTTLYEATAIDRLGCKDSVAKRIVVMPLPILNVYAEPHEFPIVECRGTPLQLLAFGAWSYEWSPNLFLSCDSCANPVVNDSFNMQYLVTGHTRFGCTDSIKVKVSVLDTNLDLFGHDTDVCFGDNAKLFASSHSINSSLDVPKFLWTPNWFLSCDSCSSPTVIAPTQSVTYTVVVTENRCFSDTATIRVNVQPYPIITISPKTSTEFAGTQRPTIVRVTNTPVKNYVWTPSATVSCDTCDTTYLAPIVNTTYTVTVTSIYGCTSDSTVTVNVGCDSRQIFIPNTFTPNGDGMNDRFYVSGKGLRNISLFEVYNRWGEVVYEVENISPNDASAGWDGTYKGKVLEPDVYMYVVKATCSLTGEQFVYKGDISIVR